MTAPTQGRKTPITYGRPHMRLTWGGVIGNGTEVWANTLNLVTTGLDGSDVAVDEDEMDDVCAQAATAVRRFWTSSRASTSTSFGLTYVKLNHVNDLGKYTAQNTHLFEYDDGPIVGTSQPLPWNVACAVTLRTSVKRGPGHAGRFFHPIGATFSQGNPYVIDPQTGLFSDTASSDLADVASELIRDLSYLDDHSGQSGEVGAHNFQVVTIPRRPSLAEALPLSHGIIAVEVDRVLDTMRSRTNAIPRTVNSAPVSTAPGQP
jgi:hypothetical protein